MYTVKTVETCRFGLDGGAMFGVVPKTLWERAYAQADAKNRIPMAARALLLQGNGRNVLVDTGNSPFMKEKQLEIYGIDFSEFTIEGSLKAHGLTTDDITDVILTHVHFDHAGGAIVNGEPRFAKAQYYVQKEHLAWARNPSLKDRASFESYMYEPLADHGVLQLVEGEGEILPGISARLMHGHTPFMQAILAQTDKGKVFFPADLFPTAAHIPSAYGMAYDNHPLTTIKEKQGIYEELVGDRWLVVFEHDALRTAGYVVMTDKGPQLGETLAL